MANPDVQSVGRARFCKTKFTKKQIWHKLNGKNQLYLKIREPKKRTTPATFQSLPSARIHKNSYNLFKHVQFQEVKGLPSNMPASYHWEPPASTLAHCLAVIHPKNQDVLAKGCLACRRQSHLQTPSTSSTPGQRCAD